jgi:hypothetical protein
MDLSKFKGAGKGPKAAQEKNVVKRFFTNMKETILPTSTEKKKERISQYKDLTMFVGAILVIAVFENKIKSFLEI